MSMVRRLAKSWKSSASCTGARDLEALFARKR
jgi:hypothetical protein